MKQTIMSTMKTWTLFVVIFLFGAVFTRVMFYVDFFYFREHSYIVYAILYLAGVIAGCMNRK